MNINRSTWQNVRLGDISKIQYGSSFKSTDNPSGFRTFRMNEIIDGIAVDNNNMKTTTVKLSEFKKYKMEQGDLLFNRTNSYEHVGRTGIFLLEGDYMFASYLLRLSVNKKIVNSFYLNSIMNSSWFQTNIKKYATKAVGQANINATSLSNFVVPLPPLNQQNKIALILNSIEVTITKLKEQKSHLKGLWKKLLDSLIDNEPIFGNLLINERLSTFSYSSVANKIMRKINPLTYGVDKIVAGENLESEDFKIRTWKKIGDGYLGPAFHVLFKAGDILYGSRRTYLRKVSVADFDGVCSNTTYVIRANEEILIQDLLKHIMLSEKFTQYSIGVSKGSTNPYINWKDLNNFTFSIPNIEIQNKIAEILDDILEMIEKLNRHMLLILDLKKRILNEIIE